MFKNKYLIYFTVLWLLTSIQNLKAEIDQNLENEKLVLRTKLSYLMDNGKFNEAIDSTKRFLNKYPTDSEILRINGMANFFNKNFKEAISSFSKASKVGSDEDKSINIYLMAQAQIKLGEFDNAEQTLKQMAAFSISSQYLKIALVELKNKKSIPEYIPGIEEQEEKKNTSEVKMAQPEAAKKDYTLTFETVGGNDSNPIFIPDNSESKNDAKSTFYSTTISGTYQSILYEGPIVYNYSIGYTSYNKEEAKAFNNLRLSLGGQWNPTQDFFKEHLLTFNNKIDQSYSAQKNPEYYFTSDTFSLNKDFATFGENKFSTKISLGYRTYANKNLDSPENDRSGYAAGLGGSHKLSHESWNWLNSISFTNNLTKGKKFNTQELSLVSNFQKITFFDIEALLSASYGRVFYPNSTNKRVDRSLCYGLDLSHDLPFFKGLSSKLSFSNLKNKSDEDTSNFTQTITSIWITYEIF